MSRRLSIVPGQEKSALKGLDRLLSDFALVYGSDTVWDIPARLQMKVSAMRHAHGSEAVKIWLAHRERRLVYPEEVGFDPSNTCSEHCINLFDGLPLVADEGRFLEAIDLLTHLMSRSAPDDAGRAEALNYVLDWLALPLQRPGTKMASALVFHGPQGSGKNLFFEIYASLYGRYAMVVGQDQLEDKFNDWASQKLFLIGDEVVARAELYHQKNKLKAFITGSTIQINAKMLPLREERNHVNVVFLSNEQQPLALEQDDRRYFVVYTPNRSNDELYRRVVQWRDEGGAAAFLGFLLRRKLGDFHAHKLPPMTQAKRDLIELGLKPAERFLAEWLRGCLELPVHPCSVEQLYRAFKRWCYMAGERFPPSQAIFTASVRRGEPQRLEYRTVTPSPLAGRKTMRCWLPAGTGPLPGVTLGDWALDCVDRFESDLARFSGVHTTVAE